MRLLLPLLALLSFACAAPQPGTARPRTRKTTFTIHRGLVYAQACTDPLTLDAYVPDGPGPFPGVLVIHGGGWSARRPADMVHIARALAARGFVAMNVVYRLAPADRYPAAVDDVREAARYARREAARLKLDPERLGAWGYSAGAHLAAMLGVGGGEDPGVDDRVAAVVAGGTPADFSKYPVSPIITPFLGLSYAEAPELWREASPVTYATPDDAPFFLYHGTADTLVEPEQARLMAEALTRAGVPARLFWIKGRGHVSAFVFDGGAVAAGIDFLDGVLAAPRG
ncbi:MAG: alpha/beta hydrolase [Elusimicrobia bacterium]|nr:alpha/beta hydrolase [Elusimicrobiota bacterium]